MDNMLWPVTGRECIVPGCNSPVVADGEGPNGQTRWCCLKNNHRQLKCKTTTRDTQDPTDTQDPVGMADATDKMPSCGEKNINPETPSAAAGAASPGS